MQRLITKYGNLETVSQKIYDVLKNKETVTEAEKRLMLIALDECKNFKGLNIDNLLEKLQEASNIVHTMEASEIKKTLDELNQKYNINMEIIHLKGKEIKTLSHAAANALITLQRQLREITSAQGVTQEAKEIEAIIKNIQKEIDGKQYYSGCIQFLSTALNQLQNIEQEFNSLRGVSGTNMKILRDQAKVINRIKAIKEAYYPIIKALSDMDYLVSDENISDEDKQNIEKTAKELKDLFDKHDSKILEFSAVIFRDICIEILGDELPNGMPIADLVSMAEADSSIFDWMRGVGDLSNPTMASMGKIIRDSQDERNRQITEIENRITRANRKLFDSGSDSRFMYGNDGYIISDLDWESYKRAKANEKKRLEKAGLRGLELKEVLDEWEINNTEERVVDNREGIKRKERVPGPAFRKPFPQLTNAQLEYYKEMMQIKGEIGTLLPAYAQKQYLPPQLRRSFLDIFKTSNGIKDGIKAILNRISDIWTIKENDEDLMKHGVIDGEKYGITYGHINNTPLRSIPIFYINQLKDQSELLKDFSGALQSLAGTAINYSAMAEIKEIVEFMGDFIKNQELYATTSEGDKEAEIMTSRVTAVVKDLYAIGKATNTTAIIDGFIDQHIYGIKNKDKGKYAKLFKSLLRFTSIKNLTVNVAGALANLSIAEVQMCIEAAAGEFFDFKDYAYAHTRLFGDGTVRSVGKLVDFYNNDKNSIDVLLADLFDPIPGRFNEQMHKRYHKTLIGKAVEKFNPMFLYASGEYIVHMAGMYAVLHHEKVKLGNKEIRLIDAFEKTEKKDGTSELKLKDGIIDKNGNPLTLDSEYFSKMRKKIREANTSSHGSMSEEEKGIIHQRMLGKAAMQFRQWMVKTYDKRFRQMYYNTNLGQWREGYTRTGWKLLAGWSNALLKTSFKDAITLEQLKKDPSEKARMQEANIRRFWAERFIWTSLTLLSFAIADLEEEEDDFWFRLWLYNHKRTYQDVINMMGGGALLQIKSIASHPIPALSTLNGLLYPVLGWRDIDDKIQKGEDKDKNKWMMNVLRYTVPFYKQIDQLLDISEDDRMFGVFDTANRYR